MRSILLSALLVCLALLAACRPTPGKPLLPTTVGQPSPEAVGTRAAPAALVTQPVSAVSPPTLADYWAGRAHFAVDVADSGLPMGESDTHIRKNGALWSYVHASDRSAGVRDQCGAAVAFPGCVVIYESNDGGSSYELPSPPTCLMACEQCPCDAEVDHIVQQQYPRIVETAQGMWMVYEYLGRVMLRTSIDGVTWSAPERVADSLVWHLWYADCPAEERIGVHPFTPFDYECLRGGPPGVYVEDGMLYVFMAQGQNPGAMGCFKRPIDETGAFSPCEHNPLFVGAATYGPLDDAGARANPFFDFRTISSAEVVRLDGDDGPRYYMFYEGVRGPGEGDPGDTQFGLGLARTLTSQLDGPWEKFPGNPIFVDLPGNIGLGHADVVEQDGRTYLYTSLDGLTRSRLVLTWNE